MPNQSGKILLILILVLLVLGASAYFLFPDLKRQQNDTAKSSAPSSALSSSSKSSDTMRNYSSKDFKMNIRIPSNFQIEDRFPLFILSDGIKKIEVVRNGTNIDNLRDYLNDFDAKRKIKEIDKSELQINGYSAIKRKFMYGDQATEQNSIYLYIDNYVYIFSTSDESLYPVLDEIVQSFEYKP